MPVTDMEDDEEALKAVKPDGEDIDGEDGDDGIDAGDGGDDDGEDEPGAARAAAGDGGDDDDEDDPDASYQRDPDTGRFALSPRAKKEMFKLRERRRTAEQETARERERAEAAERRLAEYESTASKEESERIDSEITALKARKKAALESTDLDAYDEVNEALLEARLRRERLGAGTERKPVEKPAPAAPAAPAANAMAPFARAWVEANADWFDPKGADYDPDRRERALRENTRLSKDYDVNDPRLYDELNRAVKGGRDRDADDRGRGNGGPSPPTRPGVSGARRGRRLSKEDIASMSKYGLDPNDANARREWLRNKTS